MFPKDDHLSILSNGTTVKPAETYRPKYRGANAVQAQLTRERIQYYAVGKTGYSIYITYWQNLSNSTLSHSLLSINSWQCSSSRDKPTAVGKPFVPRSDATPPGITGSKPRATMI